MPLINPSSVILGDIAANPHFDWANAISLSKQLTVESNKLTVMHNDFGGLNNNGFEANPVWLDASGNVKETTINTTAPWDASLQYYPAVFLKIDGNIHPKGSLAIVKQSVQVLEITGAASDYTGMVWITPDGSGGGNELGGLHRGFGIGENGYWESSTPLLSRIDVIVSSSDPTPTGDYYMGVGVTKWSVDDYLFARIAYNVTLAPYIAT